MSKRVKTKAKKPVSTAKKPAQKKKAEKKTLALFEVFIRTRRGLSHIHVGSVYARNGKHALLLARDCYLRRAEGSSIWVCPADSVVASSHAETEDFFEPMADKAYRHAGYYDIPAAVKNL